MKDRGIGVIYKDFLAPIDPMPIKTESYGTGRSMVEDCAHEKIEERVDRPHRRLVQADSLS